MVCTGKPDDGNADEKHLPSCILIFSVAYLRVCSSYVQTYAYIESTYGKAPNQCVIRSWFLWFSLSVF